MALKPFLRWLRCAGPLGCCYASGDRTEFSAIYTSASSCSRRRTSHAWSGLDVGDDHAPNTFDDVRTGEKVSYRRRRYPRANVRGSEGRMDASVGRAYVRMVADIFHTQGVFSCSRRRGRRTRNSCRPHLGCSYFTFERTLPSGNNLP
jgi:hypothetical protein